MPALCGGLDGDQHAQDRLRDSGHRGRGRSLQSGCNGAVISGLTVNRGLIVAGGASLGGTESQSGSREDHRRRD